MEVIRNLPDSELVSNLKSGKRMDETIKAIYRSYFDSKLFLKNQRLFAPLLIPRDLSWLA